MNTKMISNIKGFLDEVSDRIKDGEKEINFKTDQHYVSYYEGYVSGLTWVEEILGCIVEELEKNNVSVENLFEKDNPKNFLRSYLCEKECQELFSM